MLMCGRLAGTKSSGRLKVEGRRRLSLALPCAPLRPCVGGSPDRRGTYDSFSNSTSRSSCFSFLSYRDMRFLIIMEFERVPRTMYLSSRFFFLVFALEFDSASIYPVLSAKTRPDSRCDRAPLPALLTSSRAPSPPRLWG